MVSSPGPFFVPGSGVAGGTGDSMAGDFVPDADCPPVRNIWVNEPTLPDSEGGGGGSGANVRAGVPSGGVFGAGLGMGGGATAFTVGVSSIADDLVPDLA